MFTRLCFIISFMLSLWSRYFNLPLQNSSFTLKIDFELWIDNRFYNIFILVHFNCIVIKDWRKYVIVILIHCNFIYIDVYCENINYVSCLIRGILHALVIVNKRMRNYQKWWSFYILHNFQKFVWTAALLNSMLKLNFNSALFYFCLQCLFWLYFS